MTGIAPSAHAEGAGLFYKADGITPLLEPGVDQAQNNGLLVCGASATTITGTPGGDLIYGCPDTETIWKTSGGYFFACTDNKIYGLQLDTTFSTSLTALSSAVTGTLISLLPFGGALLYRQHNNIGKTTDASSFDDDWATTVASATINADYFGAMHRFVRYAFFGNGLGVIGRIDSSLAVTSTALSFYSKMYCTAISDDGTNVVLAITNNQVADKNFISDTRILFWDGFTTNTWIREYNINDPLIYKLLKTPFGVFAFGITGIWQVSIDGARKVFSRSTGIYINGVNAQIHYGQGVPSYYVNALVWGGTSGSNYAVKSYGQLDVAAPAALIHPALSTAGKNITFLEAQAMKGYIFVGDSTPLLKAYPLSTANAAQTGNSAQTVYFHVPYPVDITRIRVVFGEPLASGDTFDVDVLTDQDTAAVDFGSVSYDSAKTIRSKSFYNASGGFLKCDEQFSLLLTYTAGAVKVARIEVFGQARTTSDV